jgi:hypothetical protein
VPEYLLIKAKVQELEEAYREAAAKGHPNEARFWNNEVLHHLLVLSAAIRDSQTNRRPNGGEQ